MGTGTTITVGGSEPSTVVGRVRFHRLAGIAGLVTIAAGLAQVVVAGEPPGLGASADAVAAFFANNVGAHKIGVIISVLLGIPIALFVVGVHRSLARADRQHGSSWGVLFLYGAIMMSATAGLSEGLYAIPVLRHGAGIEPEILRMLNDGSQIARGTLGAWMAVALGSVAAATFYHRIRAAWYGWFCTFAAILGALAVVDTVSTGTGGIFAQLAFFAGFVVWVIITSVLMLRDSE